MYFVTELKIVEKLYSRIVFNGRRFFSHLRKVPRSTQKALEKMNGIVRNALRSSIFKSVVNSNAGTTGNQVSRAIWHMCNRLSKDASPIAAPKIHIHNDLCGCISTRNVQTKAEKELVEFLAEEIVAEKKAQKLKTIPTEIDGFKVSLDGAEVTLTKKTDQNEMIKISFNINHTVDTEAEPEIESTDEKVDLGEMKSKPTFDVDIVKGSQTLGFSCSFNSVAGASGADDSYNDIFGIDEITLYTGQHNEKVYAVAGEIVDGYLYDLLMNFLEEKGISNEFAEKLTELSTNYEHSAYISLLEGLSSFTEKK